MALVDREDAARVLAAGPWNLTVQGVAAVNHRAGMLHRFVAGIGRGYAAGVWMFDGDYLNCQLWVLA